MIRYIIRRIIRRILYAIPIAFRVSVVCFSLVYIAPADPLQTVMPPDATAETIAIVKHAYGFDKPLPVQFLIWLGRVVTGDFGVSIATRRPVFLEVSEALANTALLALFAVPIAFFTGYVMGAVAGSFAGRWVDRVVTGRRWSASACRIIGSASFWSSCSRSNTCCCRRPAWGRVVPLRSISCNGAICSFLYYR